MKGREARAGGLLRYLKALVAPGALLAVIYMLAVGPILWVRPLWYDELVTHWIATSGDFETLRIRMAAGTDPSPPLFHLVLFASAQMFGNQWWSIRIPALAGFALMLVCLYRFVTRRFGAYWGGVAGCLMIGSGAIYYAQEGRTYGLVFGVAGIALLCWQHYDESGRPRHALGCAGALFLAVCLHYYAVLLAFPFALAGLARVWQRRKVDWPALLIPTAPVIAMAMHLPIVRSVTSQEEFGREIAWSQPGWFFPTLFWTNAIDPLLLAVLITGCWLLWRKPTQDPTPRSFRLTEVALLTGLVLLPWAGTVFGMLVTNAAVPRYLYTAMIGAAGIGTALLYRAAGGTGQGVFLLLAGLTLGSVGLESRWYLRHSEKPSLAIPAVGDGTLPVVVDDYLKFAVLTHYAPPEVLERLYYLTDRERMSRYTRAGQMELITGVAVQKGALRGRTAEAKEFLNTHPRFLLYEPLRPEPQEGWMAQSLAERGAILKLVAVQSGGRWYAVEKGGSRGLQ